MGKLAPLQRSVFKKLLAATRVIDEDPVRRALLTGTHRKLDHPEDFTESRIKVSERVMRLNGDAEWWIPHAAKEPSLSDEVREAFRQGQSTVNEAMAALKYVGEVTKAASDADNVRELLPEENPLSASLTSTQAFQVQPTVKPLELDSPARLLIAHPLLTGFFQSAVIFIVDHGENGSLGFSINLPLYSLKSSAPITLADLSVGASSPDKGDSTPPDATSTAEKAQFVDKHLSDRQVYTGGPVSTNYLRILHRLPDVKDALPIGAGLYLGGCPEHMAEKYAKGEASEHDFLALCGESSWAPGQLDMEVRTGTWIVAETTGSFAPVFDLYNEDSENAGTGLWQQTLLRMTDESGQLGQLARICQHDESLFASLGGWNLRDT
ncbi:UPF0301 protein [Diplonema papillatum]|nr:UPF0301 protein [Diplonema papillatum]